MEPTASQNAALKITDLTIKLFMRSQQISYAPS